MKYKVYFKANDLESLEDLEAYKNTLKELQDKIKSDVIILDENNKIVYKVEAKQ